jgi:hypothetical protein
VLFGVAFGAILISIFIFEGDVSLTSMSRFDCEQDEMVFWDAVMRSYSHENKNKNTFDEKTSGSRPFSGYEYTILWPGRHEEKNLPRKLTSTTFSAKDKFIALHRQSRIQTKLSSITFNLESSAPSQRG